MKRIIAVILSLLLALSFAACGSGGDQSAGSEQTQEAETAEPKAVGELPEFSKSATIEETVLLDQDGLRITATGLSYSSYAADIELLIENESAEDYEIISESLGYSCNAINDCMVTDGYMLCEVNAGMKAKETISFSYDEMLLSGITEIGSIELGFDVSGSGGTEYKTGPLELTTSAGESTSNYKEIITNDALQKSFGIKLEAFSDETLYDEQGIRAASVGLIENSEGENNVLLELVNETENEVYAVIKEVGINGLKVYSGIWSSDLINSGKRCVVDLDLSRIVSDAALESCGIDRIGSVQLKMELTDEDGVEIAPTADLNIPLIDEKASFEKPGSEIYNANDIHIVSLGAADGEGMDEDSVFIFALVENTGDGTRKIDEDYGSLSVNGFMGDCYFDGIRLEPGECGLIKVELSSYQLEDLDISKADEVASASITLEITDGNYDKLDTPTVQLIG